LQEWGIARGAGSAAGGYLRLMLNLPMIFEVPTLVVRVTLATPATGSTHVLLLPAQNPLFFPVAPRYPTAHSGRPEFTSTLEYRISLQDTRDATESGRVGSDTQGSGGAADQQERTSGHCSE